MTNEAKQRAVEILLEDLDITVRMTPEEVRVSEEMNKELNNIYSKKKIISKADYAQAVNKVTSSMYKDPKEQQLHKNVLMYKNASDVYYGMLIMDKMIKYAGDEYAKIARKSKAEAIRELQEQMTEVRQELEEKDWTEEMVSGEEDTEKKCTATEFMKTFYGGPPNSTDVSAEQTLVGKYLAFLGEFLTESKSDPEYEKIYSSLMNWDDKASKMFPPETSKSKAVSKIYGVPYTTLFSTVHFDLDKNMNKYLSDCGSNITKILKQIDVNSDIKTLNEDFDRISNDEPYVELQRWLYMNIMTIAYKIYKKKYENLIKKIPNKI